MLADVTTVAGGWEISNLSAAAVVGLIAVILVKFVVKSNADLQSHVQSLYNAQVKSSESMQDKQNCSHEKVVSMMIDNSTKACDVFDSTSRSLRSGIDANTHAVTVLAESVRRLSCNGGQNV